MGEQTSKLPIAALLAVLLSACASVESSRSLAERDRFRNLNEFSFNTHERIDGALIRPVARGYDALPEKLTNRVGNFFDNLHGPVDIANNLLQGKLKHGFSGIGRLLVNTTIGLAGLFDPASRIGLPQHREDFGQTLAVWGVPSGPYLFVPVIGPSTARDLVGRIFDWQIDPIPQNDDTGTRNSLVAGREIARRADYLSDSTEGALDRRLNRYNAVLDTYEQTREYDIFDGEPPDWIDHFGE